MQPQQKVLSPVVTMATVVITSIIVATIVMTTVIVVTVMATAAATVTKQHAQIHSEMFLIIYKKLESPVNKQHRPNSHFKLPDDPHAHPLRHPRLSVNNATNYKNYLQFLNAVQVFTTILG